MDGMQPPDALALIAREWRAALETTATATRVRDRHRAQARMAAFMDAATVLIMERERFTVAPSRMFVLETLLWMAPRARRPHRGK